jgi:hypothetical protein
MGMVGLAADECLLSGWCCRSTRRARGLLAAGAVIGARQGADVPEGQRWKLLIESYRP